MKKLIYLICMMLLAHALEAQPPFRMRTDNFIIKAGDGTADLTLEGGDLTLTKYETGDSSYVFLVCDKLTGKVDTLTLIDFIGGSALDSSLSKVDQYLEGNRIIRGKGNSLKIDSVQYYWLQSDGSVYIETSDSPSGGFSTTGKNFNLTGTIGVDSTLSSNILKDEGGGNIMLWSQNDGIIKLRSDAGKYEFGVLPKEDTVNTTYLLAVTPSGRMKIRPISSLGGDGIGTDNQVITISNDTIYLEDGGFVKLPDIPGCRSDSLPFLSIESQFHQDAADFIGVLGNPGPFIQDTLISGLENLYNDDGLVADRPVGGDSINMQSFQIEDYPCGCAVDSFFIHVGVDALSGFIFPIVSLDNIGILPQGGPITSTGDVVLKYNDKPSAVFGGGPFNGVIISPPASGLYLPSNYMSERAFFTIGSPNNSADGSASWSIDYIWVEYFTDCANQQLPTCITINSDSNLIYAYEREAEITDISGKADTLDLIGKADTSDIYWVTVDSNNSLVTKYTNDFIRTKLAEGYATIQGDHPLMGRGWFWGDYSSGTAIDTDKGFGLLTENGFTLAGKKILFGSILDSIQIYLNHSSTEKTFVIGASSDFKKLTLFGSALANNDTVVTVSDATYFHFRKPAYGLGGAGPTTYSPITYVQFNYDSSSIKSKIITIGGSVVYSSDTLVSDTNYYVHEGAYFIGYDSLTASRNIDLTGLKKGQEILIYDLANAAGTQNITFSDPTGGGLPTGINITTNNGWRRIRRLNTSSGQIVIIGSN